MLRVLATFRTSVNLHSGEPFSSSKLIPFVICISSGTEKDPQLLDHELRRRPFFLIVVIDIDCHDSQQENNFLLLLKASTCLRLTRLYLYKHSFKVLDTSVQLLSPVITRNAKPDNPERR